MKNFADRKGRKIVVDGVNWIWNCGSRGRGVVAYSELGQRIYAHKSEICGEPKWTVIYDDEERVAPITPSAVSEWIRSKSAKTK
jgi:hypothetical protein